LKRIFTPPWDESGTRASDSAVNHFEHATRLATHSTSRTCSRFEGLRMREGLIEGNGISENESIAELMYPRSLPA
jgi:hypothetical protein